MNDNDDLSTITLDSFDLSSSSNTDDVMSVTDDVMSSPYIAPTVTITSNGTSASDLQWGGAISGITGSTGQGYLYTTGTSANWSALNIPSSNTSINQAGKISLNGKAADIDINGKSLSNWMEKVEERLNILTPNPDMEKEWDELRRLGERYRKLEKRCKEKSEVWNKLKAMPPPELD